MKKIMLLILITSIALSGCEKKESDQTNMSSEVKTVETAADSVGGIVVKDMLDNDVNLSEYKGKVLLIVNVASKCGYTPQYEGLQAIYEKYNAEGFEILAFPCNDFKSQEPGTNEEIQQFCSVNYNITFKLFDKIKVLGDDKSPLYNALIKSPGIETGDVKWNFEKFLINKNGKIVNRFRSAVKPESEEITSAIEKLLHE